MPRQDDDDRKQRQAIDSRSSVLRAMLRSGWIDSETDSILPDAYIPRKNGVDDSGLSVTVASTGSEAGIREEARSFADGFRKTYGVALLNVGNVREEDSKLDVIADPLIDSPNHALITGIPRPDHDTREAERLAGKLARISRRIL